MEVIEINKISLAYGEREVLRDFSAHISRNSITAIVGPNGSGKSTLLGAIAGDIPVISGEILINALSVADLNREELAYLRSFAAQSHSYWMAYSVEEILHLGHDSVDSKRFDYITTSLDMKEILSHKVTALSGGELQRVEIARAFMRQTPLILLDEPFASQDRQSITRIIDLMERERSDNGATFVVVAHSRNEDLTWASHTVELTY